MLPPSRRRTRTAEAAYDVTLQISNAADFKVSDALSPFQLKEVAQR